MLKESKFFSDIKEAKPIKPEDIGKSPVAGQPATTPSTTPATTPATPPVAPAAETPKLP
jgi:hypothetical protein